MKSKTQETKKPSNQMEFGHVTKRKVKYTDHYKVNPLEWAANTLKHQGYDASLRITNSLRVPSFGSDAGSTANLNKNFYEAAYQYIKARGPKKSAKA